MGDSKWVKKGSAWRPGHGWVSWAPGTVMTSLTPPTRVPGAERTLPKGEGEGGAGGLRTRGRGGTSFTLQLAPVPPVLRSSGLWAEPELPALRAWPVDCTSP